MLSSRYVKLHEALGLGPMWLKQKAYIKTVEPTKKQTPITPINHCAQNNHPHPTQQIPAPSSQSKSILLKTKQNTTALVSDTNAVSIPKTPSTLAPITSCLPDKLADIVMHCQRCHLHQERRQPIVGYGSIPAMLMVITSNPSPEDDVNHELFNGKIGQLLTNMLRAIKIPPEQVYFTTQVKCTPNLSLQVQQEHIEACLPYLQQQIQWVQPKAILFMGKILQKLPESLQQQIIQDINHIVIPHPAQLLRHSHLKAPTWQSLQKLKQFLHK